jgi:hypothetical protein
LLGSDETKRAQEVLVAGGEERIMVRQLHTARLGALSGQATEVVVAEQERFPGPARATRDEDNNYAAVNHEDAGQAAGTSIEMVACST